MPELGRSPESPKMDQEQRREASEAHYESFELLGSGDLSFFMPVFPLLEHCVSHRSVKWLWNDLVRQEILKACIRQW